MPSWTSRLSAVLLPLAALGACDGTAAGGDSAASDGACESSDAPARLTLENRTGSSIDTITMRACDGSALEDERLESPVADGSDVTIDLPSSGCWILSYAGDDCFNDPKHQTTPQGVCGGDTHVWRAGSDTHSCSGAGW